jgi:WD40 repeat protein
MHGARRLFITLFAMVSSCGPAPDGSGDTAGVSGETRREEPVAAVETAGAADPVGLPTAEPRRPVGLPTDIDHPALGFAGGSRFAILEAGEDTVVYDNETQTGFAVYGRAVADKLFGLDPFVESGFTHGLDSINVATSGDGTRMLVHTEGGIQIVDLGRRGALLAGLRTDASDASIAPDGEGFAAWTDASLTLVRASDGARVSYAIARPKSRAITIVWTARAISFVDDSGPHVIDRATWRKIDAVGDSVTFSNDGSIFVVERDGNAKDPGFVETWRLDAPRGPTVHVASALVSQVKLSDDASKVAWSEYSGDYAAPQHLHLLDVASGVHLRFPSRLRCSITGEMIEGLVGGELRTSLSCSPGCPSVAQTPEYAVYDASTGAALRTSRGETEPPYNLELGARLADADAIASRFGGSRDDGTITPAMIHHPHADQVLLARASGLAIADATTAKTMVELDRSQPWVTAASFSPDGAYVVGAVDGRMVAWSAATGVRLWENAR